MITLGAEMEEFHQLCFDAGIDMISGKPSGLLQAFSAAKTPHARDAVLFAVHDAALKMIAYPDIYPPPFATFMTVYDELQKYDGTAPYGFLRAAALTGFTDGAYKLLEQRPLEYFHALVEYAVAKPERQSLLPPLWMAGGRKLHYLTKHGCSDQTSQKAMGTISLFRSGMADGPKQ